MSRQGAQWDDWEQDKVHKERRLKKIDKIRGLTDLLDTWEPLDTGDDEIHGYILLLRAKLRCARNQLEAMRL